MKKIKIDSPVDLTLMWQKNGYLYTVLNGGQTFEQSYYYELSKFQVNKIIESTLMLHEMMQDYVKHSLNQPSSSPYHELLCKSFDKNPLGMMGRFDFFFDGEKLKLFEFNAETPALLLEAGIAQKVWAKHYAMKDRNDLLSPIEQIMKNLYKKFHDKTFYFASHLNTEDFHTTKFLANMAQKSGFKVVFFDINHISIEKSGVFFEEDKIEILFQFIPWDNYDLEQIKILNNVFVFEPFWKHLIENKRMMAYLYEHYEDKVDFLLPTYLHVLNILIKNNGSYIKKPNLSRQGQGIQVYEHHKQIFGPQSQQNHDYIYQEYCPAPCYDKKYPVLSSFLINGKFAGIAIRESDHFITCENNTYVPYAIK